jgi:MFS superfamily sulfate permease-like transporter
MRRRGLHFARFARMIPQAVLRGIVVFIGLGMAAWFFWRNP